MKTSNSIRRNRRAFLKGLGSVAIGLPFLEGMPERSAWAATQNPVFGLFICTANGVVQRWADEPERFWPTQVGPLTTESMQASAAERATGILAEHASRLLIVRGVNYPFGITGCGHAQGLVQCLTASRPNGTDNRTTPQGVSVDTVIAENLNPPGVEPLTLYSGMKGGFIDEKLSFSAPGRVRAAEGNPYNVYQRLVGLAEPGGGDGGDGGMADRLFLRRKSVNDLVREELNDLRNRPALSAADRERLDQHFSAIRDIENTIDEMGRSCTTDGIDVQALEAINSGNAFRANGQIEEVAKLHMDLVAFAFACNATRVATLQIGDGTDGTRYTINGETLERFHWISHRIQSDGSSGAAIPNAVEMHAAIDRLRMETFKHLIDRWSGWSVANGPLLDNAFAYWTSHVSTGPPHGFDNLPILIAGSAGGYLKQGQYIDAGRTTNNRVFNTLITAMGHPMENFGDGGLSGGIIPEMVA